MSCLWHSTKNSFRNQILTHDAMNHKLIDWVILESEHGFVGCFLATECFRVLPTFIFSFDDFIILADAMQRNYTNRKQNTPMIDVICSSTNQQCSSGIFLFLCCVIRMSLLSTCRWRSRCSLTGKEHGRIWKIAIFFGKWLIMCIIEQWDRERASEQIRSYTEWTKSNRTSKFFVVIFI